MKGAPERQEAARRSGKKRRAGAARSGAPERERGRAEAIARAAATLLRAAGLLFGTCERHSLELEPLSGVEDMKKDECRREAE